MAQYYDRYSRFKLNAEIEPVPGIKIPELPTDKFFLYKKGTSRLDIISDEYYNNPYSGWLIMLANQQFGGLEFNIPDNTLLRVPYPFNEAINSYINQVSIHKKLYG
jgi:hypothetical protein